MTRVLVLVGSIVTPCGVARLSSVVADGARALGAEVSQVQLLDLDLPLFSMDRERADGPPPALEGLRAAVAAADGLVVGAPELNGSVTGVLKNSLDWLSRPHPDGPVLRGVPVVMVSGSKWEHAGFRGLVGLRATLAGLGAVVLPDELSVPHAPPRFTPEGVLPDAGLAGRLHHLAAALLEHCRSRA